MRAAALLAIGMSMLGLARAGDMAAVTQRPIQIRSEELRLALQTFGELEDLHVVFVSEDVQNLNTRGVVGNVTPEGALEELLGGTGFTYRFLDSRTVMILPASTVQATPAESKLASALGDETAEDVGGRADAGVHVNQVTVTAPRQPDAQQLEYFRELAAMSRSEYKRIASAIPFVDRGMVKFPGGEGPNHLLKVGRHTQTAGVDGIVLSRVFDLTTASAAGLMQVHNSNSFPVFAEIDYEKAKLGEGTYFALAPGETLTIWNWAPRRCLLTSEWRCYVYTVLPGTARVRTLTAWKPAEGH